MHLAPIGSNNTGIDKIFNSGRHLVARCVKHFGLTHDIMEPEYEYVVLQVPREVHQFHKSIDFYCTAGHLKTKGIKFQQVRFWSTINVSMGPIRRRSWLSRSTSAVWHIDLTRKLVKSKLIESWAVDGHSRCIMWLKWSRNKKGKTAHRLLKEDITMHIDPLQDRGDKVSKNKNATKHVVILLIPNAKVP